MDYTPDELARCQLCGSHRHNTPNHNRQLREFMQKIEADGAIGARALGERLESMLQERMVTCPNCKANRLDSLEGHVCRK